MSVFSFRKFLLFSMNRFVEQYLDIVYECVYFIRFGTIVNTADVFVLINEDEILRMKKVVNGLTGCCRN